MKANHIFNRPNQLAVAASTVFTILLLGCGTGLSTQHEITLTSNDIKSVIVDAVGFDQTIKVTVSSAGSPVDAHIHVAGDEDAVDSALALKKDSDKILAAQLGTNSATLEALIPAGKEAVVRLQGAGLESSTVTLVITN